MHQDLGDLVTAILVPAVYMIDWLLVGATVGIYAWLRHLGLGDAGIWLVLWAGNILLSGAVVLGGEIGLGSISR